MDEKRWKRLNMTEWILFLYLLEYGVLVEFN